jgi:hypothetical protein
MADLHGVLASYVADGSLPGAVDWMREFWRYAASAR